MRCFFSLGLSVRLEICFIRGSNAWIVDWTWCKAIHHQTGGKCSVCFKKKRVVFPIGNGIGKVEKLMEWNKLITKKTMPSNHMPHDFEKQFDMFQDSPHFSLISFLICVLKKTANQLRIFQKLAHFATIIPNNLCQTCLLWWLETDSRPTLQATNMGPHMAMKKFWRR